MARGVANLGLRLTERDVSLLAETYLATVVDIRQYVAFGFFAGVSRARRRLAKLESGGFVRRRYLAADSAAARSVFAIGPAAVGPICGRTELDRADVARRARTDISRLLAEHSLMVGDVRAVLAGAEAEPRGTFTPEPLVREEYGVSSGVGENVERRVFRPDGLFIFNGGRRVAAFLEADRGNVGVRRWGRAMAGYRRYVRLGLFAETYGDAAPVLLVVTTGRARIASLARETAKMDAPRVYYATIDALRIGGSAGRVWARSPGSEPVSIANLLEGSEK